MIFIYAAVDVWNSGSTSAPGGWAELIQAVAGTSGLGFVMYSPTGTMHCCYLNPRSIFKEMKMVIILMMAPFMSASHIFS